MAKTIRFDLRGAYEAGYTAHPQQVVEDMGMKVLKYEGMPIADCAMMEVKHLPEELPDFIEASNHVIE